VKALPDVTAICVYCSSAEPIEPEYLQLAEAVGAGIAARGYTLVSGGGCVSMMGALARSARAGGAHTLGVIPATLVGREVADVDADELVVVDTMRERKAIMDTRADAFVALPGGLGTLEELFEVWTSGVLGMHSKPVVVVNLAGFYDPLFTFLDSLRRRGFVRQGGLDRAIEVADADAAFAALDAAFAAAP
jgi:hypothetical protein